MMFLCRFLFYGYPVLVICLLLLFRTVNVIQVMLDL